MQPPREQGLIVDFRTVLTVATVAGLTSLYGLYSQLTRPLFVVKAVHQAERSVPQRINTTRPVKYVEVAAEHLAEQAWAEKARYQTSTQQGYIYTNQWTPEEDGGKGIVRLEPFAMVWLLPDKDGESRAVTLVSESARLKFDGKLEGQNPQPGRVVAAAMQGEVQVTGPDGLKLVGRNFYFEEAALRIYSDNSVVFDIGPNHGSASSVQLDLIPSSGLISDDRPQVFGIQTVRLNQNIRLDVELRQRKDKIPVSIECAGTLEYDIPTHVSTLREDVWVWRKTGPNESDYMQCDKLTLRFGPRPVDQAAGDLAQAPEEPAIRQVSAEEDYQRIETELAFSSLTAEGNEVRLRSDKQDLTATLTRLDYEVERDGVMLRHPESVTVFQRKSWMKSPEIFVQFDDKSGGAATCKGPGELVNCDPETREILFSAEWQESLSKSRDARTGLDVITLLGDAVFKQPQRESGLLAHQIRLWVDPIEPIDPTAASSPSLEGNPANVQPRRMLAERDVAFASPQLVGESEIVELIFRELGPLEAPPEMMEEAAQSGGKTVSKDGTEKPAAPARPPVRVDAKSITVNLISLGEKKQPHVEHVTTIGQVSLRQPRPDGGQSILTGDRVDLFNRGGTAQTAHLVGAPALLRDGTMQLEGNSIHMDRGANLVWVEGAGFLRLPVDRSFDGKPLPEPQMLDTRWKEQMSFDGQLAQFAGEVSATLAQSRMNCRDMRVTLKERLSFRESLDKPASKPELASIVCRQNVVFLHLEYDEQRRLASTHRVSVHEFDVNQITGATMAQGPGFLQSWRRTEGKGSSLPTRTSADANRPRKVDTHPWEYTRVDFSGRMTGNVHRETSTFRDRVRILHAPVARPADEVNPDAMPENGMSMKCRELEVSRAAGSSRDKMQVEIVGSGDVLLEGHGYVGRADQVSFDQARQLFEFRSFGTAMATIWKEDASGNAEPANRSQHIVFDPWNKKITVSRSAGGAGGP